MSNDESCPSQVPGSHLPPPQPLKPPWLFSLRSPSPPNPATPASLTEFWKNFFLFNSAKKGLKISKRNTSLRPRGKEPRGKGTVSFQSADNLPTRLVEDHLVGMVEEVFMPWNSLTQPGLAGRLASSPAGSSVVRRPNDLGSFE